MNRIRNATALHRLIHKVSRQTRLDYEELRSAFFILRNGSGRYFRRADRDVLEEAARLLLAMPD